MIKTLLLFSVLISSSFAFVEQLEYARDLTFSSHVKINEVVKGPPGTWIELFRFKIGGIIKEEKYYCFFYQAPLAGRKGKVILAHVGKANCRWSPSLKLIFSEDEVELLVFSKTDPLFKMKYLSKSRKKEISSKLYNNEKIYPGIILIPTNPKFLKGRKNLQKELCGLRNHHACIKRASQGSRDQCLDMDYYYFCNPGTSLSCRDQKVFCL